MLNPKNQNRPQEPNNGLVYKAQVRWLFHAHIKIKIPAFCDEDLFDQLYAVLEEVDDRYNSYSDHSYFDRINKNAGSMVEVDNETIDILKQVLFYSTLFDGEYDITVMPLIRLWGFYKDDQRRIPSDDAIREVRKNTDYRKIKIEGNKVSIAKGQEIITGSFIKAYAVDKLVQKIKSIGITDAIINAGGSTIRAVNNKTHPCWRIDVTDPEDKTKNLFVLKITDSCFSTSSQTKNFVEIDGRKYGHILSPTLGYPSQNKQIGIVSDNCFLGDVISTGLYNCTLDGFTEKMEQISAYHPVSGFLMDKHRNVRLYGDFEKYIIENNLLV